MTSLDNMPDMVMEYYLDEVGYELLPLERGFILYSTYDDKFIINEMYIKKAKGMQDYKQAYYKVNNYCVENKLNHIVGTVNLNKYNANKVIKLHLFCGAVIINAQSNIVEIYKSVEQSQADCGISK